MNELGMALLGRVERLAKEVREIAKEVEAEEWYEEGAHGALRRLALDLLRGTEGVECGVTISRHDGCDCHGKSGDEEITAYTLDHLACLLSRHADAEGADISRVTWRVPISGVEESEARVAYEVHKGHHMHRKNSAEALAVARAACAASTEATRQATKDLDARRGELLPEAIATREEAIGLLMAKEAECRRAREAAEVAELLLLPEGYVPTSMAVPTGR